MDQLHGTYLTFEQFFFNYSTAAFHKLFFTKFLKLDPVQDPHIKAAGSRSGSKIRQKWMWIPSPVLQCIKDGVSPATSWPPYWSSMEQGISSDPTISTFIKLLLATVYSSFIRAKNIQISWGEVRVLTQIYI